MLAKKLLILTSLLVGGVIIAPAQGFYDDDIYYNPAKDTKAKQEMAAKAAQKAAQQAAQYNYNPTLGVHDYAGADTYQVTGSSTRDVDEYNRRGAYASADTTAADANGDDFTYTRRIEKYHNGDIIADINDPELVEYYYSSQPDVNIIINAPGYGWGSPWGYNYYAWNSPWYWNSWDWYWGPSWSWSWGWGPSWSWGWGPSWGPGWGPGWGPAWRPGWGCPAWGPSWAYHPGSTTGRRPVGIRNGYTGVGNSSLRPSGSGTANRGGVTHESLGNYRPGSSSSRPAYNNQGGAYRPGSSARPSNNNGTSRPSNNGSWGTTRGNRGNNNSYNNNNNYNSNRSYSAPSHSSPSRGGGYSGGGAGGGSHRGGRR